MANFTLFTCKKQFDKYGIFENEAIKYCVANKSYLILIIMLLIEIIRQIYIYRRVYLIQWSDSRILLFSIGILSLVNLFV